MRPAPSPPCWPTLPPAPSARWSMPSSCRCRRCRVRPIRAQVVDAVMSAEQALQAAVAIRDKIVTAYMEVSRMAI